MTMTVLSPGARSARTLLQAAIYLLHALPIRLDNILDMRDAIEILFQLVQLPVDIGEASDFRIGQRHGVAGAVVLLRGHHGGLLGQVLDSVRDLLHQTVEVAGEGGQGGTVEEQKALRGGARCGARRGAAGGGGCGLVVSQETDLVGCEAQLCIWDRVGR